MTVPTCEFKLRPDDFCLAPAFGLVRWRWVGGEEFEMGALCEGHFVIGCEQLCADPGVDPDSIEVMRIEE